MIIASIKMCWNLSSKRKEYGGMKVKQKGLFLKLSNTRISLIALKKAAIYLDCSERVLISENSLIGSP